MPSKIDFYGLARPVQDRFAAATHLLAPPAPLLVQSVRRTAAWVFLATAALLLGSEKDAATVAALRDALKDKDWHVRAAAVHALALQNNPAMRKDLDPMIEDESEGVRLRAAAAVLRLAAIQKRSAGAAHPAASQTLKK